LELKFRNFKKEFVSAEMAPFLKDFSHLKSRMLFNAIRRAVLSKQKSVGRRQFLRSIAQENRRRSFSQPHPA